jgi:hypothetical protein
MLQNLSSLLQFAVVGGAISVGLQLLKQKFGLESAKSKLIIIASSLVVGGGFVWLQSTPYLNAVLGVLGASSIIYSLIVKDAMPTSKAVEPVTPVVSVEPLSTQPPVSTPPQA